MITEPFSPILAEIADKMPTVFELWKEWSAVALFFAVVTFATTSRGRWVGLVPVFLAVAFSLWLHRPDLEYATIVELGYGYLAQHYITGFLPAIVSAFVWLAAVKYWRRQPTFVADSKPGAQVGS